MPNTFLLNYEKIKIEALRSGKSLTDVAKCAQIDINFATRLCAGRRFRASTIAKIADVLGVDPTELIVSEVDHATD